MAEIVNTHFGTQLDWQADKRAHNPYVISLLQNSAAFDLSDRTFTLSIYNNEGETDAVLTLTEGSGLTNGGAAGTLAIALTSAQAGIKLSRPEYFYKITYVYSEKTYTLFFGRLRLSERNPSSTTTAQTVSISDGSGVTLTASIAMASVGGSVPVSAFATELTFNYDKDLTTVTGGTRTFTLAASGHENGVGIIARINAPTAVNFPEEFEAVEGSSSISTTGMNIIILRYYEDYDGSGNDKVLYLVRNQAAI